ncbi:hypothetical protein [Streptomyces sp. NPDC002685]|uniref:hypothetical protein n=1 Tax=Streptomyces sp. NPDC002685 TaxID=3154540 RepID=UPI003318BA07
MDPAEGDHDRRGVQAPRGGVAGGQPGQRTGEEGDVGGQRDGREERETKRGADDEHHARPRIPLDRHPCDGPDWQLVPPGVLLLPGDHGAGERDPSGFVAESTWLYPRRYGTLTALIETPAWCVPAVSDARPAAAPAGEMARVGEVLLGHTEELTAALGVGGTRPSPRT